MFGDHFRTWEEAMLGVKELLLAHAKSGVVVLTLTAGAAVSSTAQAADSGALVGNWKLVSWQVVVGNESQSPFGSHPIGYLLLTREGRAMALTTADARKPGESVAEWAALHKSMLAYSGKYRVEGDDFITTVDISWNEIWNGTEQRRHYRIEGDRLFIESAPAPSILYPGKTDFAESFGSERNRLVQAQVRPAAGAQCLLWDKLRRTQHEHMSSGLRSTPLSNTRCFGSSAMRTRRAAKRHVSGPFVPPRQLIFCHFTPTSIVSAEIGDISGIWCLRGLRAFSVGKIMVTSVG